MEDNIFISNVAKTTLLIAYTPLGLILCISRFFLAIQTCVVLSILPEEFILSRLIRGVTSVFLGMYVQRENFENRQQNTRVFVAYRDTNLAHIASRIALPVMVLHTRQFMMGWLFGQVSCGESTCLRYEAEKILNRRIEVRPVLHIAAENKSFHFDEWPFFLHQAIHPMSITTYNPLLPSYVKLPSSTILDLIFLFFFPITLITVRIHPSLRRQEQEMTQEFRRRIEGFLEQAITNPSVSSQTPNQNNQHRQFTRQVTLPNSKSDRDFVLHERKQVLTNENLRKFKEKYGSPSM